MKQVLHQRLPSGGAQREALRETGQFWTPDWVADAMVGYVAQGDADHIFDPAVGAGAFFRAAKRVSGVTGRPLALRGMEIDPLALEQAAQTGLVPDDLTSVQMQNFILHPPAQLFKAIVANPPYIRHHRVPPPIKAELKSFSRRLLGVALDGRAGLHVYFLLRALQLLDDDGRLAFIVPADTCEGKFAPSLWAWIAEHYRLDAVVTFAPEATPFPTVDTNAVIVMLRKAPPLSEIRWARCFKSHTEDLKKWTLSAFERTPGEDLRITHRQLREALDTGLSRPRREHDQPDTAVLADFATVMRGIATGANDFFFLTNQQVRTLCMPDCFFRVAVGRTRDVSDSELTVETLRRLDTTGRPTRLLCLDARPKDDLPPQVRAYLAYGEELGLPQRSLIAQRKPWYKMEVRLIPPFLFAYLGRRNARFIRNSAGALPLTGFLCVYPRRNDPEFIEKLWILLQHPDTQANLASVGKSYGSGAIKVEPRALERLPLPAAALAAAGLGTPSRIVQPRLLERSANYVAEL